MKTIATVIVAAGLAAVTTSASAFRGPCDNDRYSGGYAPYYNSYAPVPALSEEQIKAQQDAVAAQQKAAAEYFAQIEEQRKAQMAAFEAQQKAAAEHFAQMEEQRKAQVEAFAASQKAAAERFQQMEIQPTAPHAFAPPVAEPRFAEIEKQAAAIRAEMQKERAAMQAEMDKRHEEMQAMMQQRRQEMEKNREQMLTDCQPFKIGRASCRERV